MRNCNGKRKFIHLQDLPATTKSREYTTNSRNRKKTG